MPVFHGICVRVTIYLNPSDVDAFFAVFKPVFDAICAERELMSFEIYRSPEEPGKISWAENWNATQDWLMEKQITKDYYKDYFATTEQMYIKPREIEILERMGSPFSAYKPELLNDSVL
ncbi:hypothetical protein LIA77_10842 [Sarocladium implicatum]|nr:hypothetical protein LIA77_10842 [Sarocladium implicatum]